MQSEFLLAQKYYQHATNYSLFDTDYALYYQSKCLGLLGNNVERIRVLETVIKNFRHSIYFDNALFDIA